MAKRILDWELDDIVHGFSRYYETRTTKSERVKAKHWRADPWPASNEWTPTPQLHQWISQGGQNCRRSLVRLPLDEAAMQRRQENNGKRKLLKRKT
jgi:hypothetical protein